MSYFIHEPSVMLIALLFIFSIVILITMLVQFLLPTQVFSRGSKSEQIPHYVSEKNLNVIVSDSRYARIHLYGRRFMSEFDLRPVNGDKRTIRIVNNDIEFSSSEGDILFSLLNVRTLELISEDTTIVLIPTGERDPNKRLAYAESI